jgi:DNA-binding CsgD family transcriptional regulator
VCRPLLDQLDALPERQRAALRTALGLAQEASLETDRLVLGAATLGLLEAASDAEPLLLVVDDADWLDGESAAVLLFAARRLAAESVAVLFAGREGVAGQGLEELEVRGLEEDAARALLGEVAPQWLAAEVGEALVEKTRGNPLALVELPSTLAPAQLRGDEPLEEPLRVGPDVERAFARRVTMLGEEARRALLIAAASDTNELGSVVAALEQGGLDRNLLESAEDDGLLRLEGATFDFRHPLVRSAVYHGAAASERRNAHRSLADALAGVDDERVAWHRSAAAIAPDEQAAGMLEEAGTKARERAAYASAAAAFERAARLGDLAEQVRRLALAADAAWLGGAPETAAALVSEGLQVDPEPELRADLLALQARIELYSGSQPRAYQWFVEAADLVEETNPDKAADMLAEAIAAGIQSAGPELQEAAERLEQLPRSDDPFRQLVLAQALNSAASVGGSSEAAANVRETVANLDEVAASLTSPAELFWVGRAYFMVGRNADASSVASEAVRRARGGQATGLLPQLLRLLGSADFDRGEWMTARAAAAESAELAEELGQTTTACASLGLLAELESAVGAGDHCREHARRAIEIATGVGLGFYRERAERALGRLELVEERLDAAAEQLERSAARLEKDGNRELNVSPLPDLVEVNARRGSADAAERALTRLLAIADGAMPNEEGLIARCRGIVAGDEEFGAHFLHGLERHDADLFPFDRARTALCFGERLRRAGERKAAQEHLSSAATAFEALGATPWLERARDELRASGRRLRARDADRDRLTPREAQIAGQVAEGKSNREVAEALYLTPKTVEFHLTRVYRKLGVRSRSELVRIMSRD